VRRSGEGYRFDVAIRGRLGERVSVAVDGKRAKAPTLKLANPDGTFQASADFEYG
jgi:hypothetical protein